VCTLSGTASGLGARASGTKRGSLLRARSCRLALRGVLIGERRRYGGRRVRWMR
jgi:hypothetical protein